MGRRRRRAKHGSTVGSDTRKVMVRAQVADRVIGVLRVSAFGWRKRTSTRGWGLPRLEELVLNISSSPLKRTDGFHISKRQANILISDARHTKQLMLPECRAVPRASEAT